ncbi:MAG: caspase family protein [Henriciella sp.]|nr:caspase family protein [Henriciella sp.]
MLRLISLFCLFLLINQVSAVQAQERNYDSSIKRIALIIAVSDSELVPGLTAPENDAYHVADALQFAGFDVDILLNPSLQEARSRLDEFKFESGDADDALVYYTGIGLEIEGKNLLAATDSEYDENWRTVDEYAPEWISTAELANTVRVARNQGLVFLDGGRWNPFGQGTRGFVAEARSAGVIMLYSSGAGETAVDRKLGSPISPFAEAVAKYMVQPGLAIRPFLEYVSADVRIATGGAQNPEYTGLNNARPFYFTPSSPLVSGEVEESSGTEETSGMVLAGNGNASLTDEELAGLVDLGSGMVSAEAGEADASDGDSRDPTVPLTQFVWTDQPRLALVIGVSDYNGDGDLDDDRYSSAVQQEGYAPDLANAINDARDMKNALESIRFDVTYVENPDKITVSDAFFEFESKITDAGEDAIVVVFYAGHAIQVSGTNYVIPASAQLPSLDFRRMTEAQVEYRLSNHAVPLNLLYERLKNPSDNGMNLIILDACRENPWETRVGRNIPGMGGESRGLADIVLQVDRTAIAYSTKPGDIAADGDGVNSPYTSALKVRITEPGLNVRDLFSKVAGDVIKATERQQSPWLNSPYLGETCLGACYPEAG